MAISLNGTTGITTPDITSAGSLNIDASAPDNSLVVNSAGNVGIGTSSPNEKLMVAGAIRSTSNAINWAASDGAVMDYNAGEMRLVAARSGANSSAISFTTYNAGIAAESARIDSAGRVTMPYQPAFQTKTQGSSHTGGWSKFTGFTSNDYNTGNNWSLANNLFTAPIAGLYTFYVGGWMNGNSIDARFGYNFRINGGELTYICGGSEAVTDTPIPAGVVTLSLAANDYMELYLFLAGGTRQMGTGSHCFYLGGHLIG
jgi:hypothetical protein